MPENENKSKFSYVEVDRIPPAIIGPRNEDYDKAISAVQTSQGSTINVQIADLSPKQVYAGLHPRVVKFNENPDRAFDILLAQRKGETFLKRDPKDSLINNIKK